MKEEHLYREDIHLVRKHLRSKFDEEEKAPEAAELEQLKKIFEKKKKKEKGAELL